MHTFLYKSAGKFIILCLILTFISTSCVNKPAQQNTNNLSGAALSAQRQAQVIDLVQITDGILHCLATSKYDWLKNYTDTELNGPQVARLLLGDAAFDRVIIDWNSQLTTATFNDTGDAAIISIPVKHQARVNVKFGPKTSLFNFHYYFSSKQKRWLLNFSQLLSE